MEWIWCCIALSRGEIFVVIFMQYQKMCDERAAINQGSQGLPMDDEIDDLNYEIAILYKQLGALRSILLTFSSDRLVFAQKLFAIVSCDFPVCVLVE